MPRSLTLVLTKDYLQLHSKTYEWEFWRKSNTSLAFDYWRLPCTKADELTMSNLATLDEVRTPRHSMVFPKRNRF